MPRPVPGSTHDRALLYGAIGGATWDEALSTPTWDLSSGTWDDSGAVFGEDASNGGVYLPGAYTVSATFRCDADAGADWSGAAGVGLLEMDADAGTIFYGRADSFWTCDSEAGADWTGHATEWHVSGLRMDAEAGASFPGYSAGVGPLIMDADAGFEIWPRLRAIPESCLGANTEPEAGDAGELSNYVY
jgi:hypothetical protein